MLNLDLLRVFIAVQESGGFTRAASLLHRSQSAVSMQIKRLEDILGVAVFDRGTTNVQLTSEGEIFIGYARRILSLVDESISKVNAKTQTKSIRLGCIEDYATRILPGILAEFWSEHPDIHIEVNTGETPQLLSRLGSDYDVVLAMHPSGSGEGRIMCHDRLTWVVSAGQSPHGFEPVPIALRPEGCIEREWAILALESAGLPWRCAYVSAGTGTLQTAVEQGLAVGVFKGAITSSALRQLGPEEGFPPLPEIEISLHVASGSMSVPVVNLLCEKLANELGKDSRAAYADL